MFVTVIVFVVESRVQLPRGQVIGPTMVEPTAARVNEVMFELASPGGGASFLMYAVARTGVTSDVSSVVVFTYVGEAWTSRL